MCVSSRSVARSCGRSSFRWKPIVRTISSLAACRSATRRESRRELLAPARGHRRHRVLVDVAPARQARRHAPRQAPAVEVVVERAHPHAGRGADVADARALGGTLPGALDRLARVGGERRHPKNPCPATPRGKHPRPPRPAGHLDSRAAAGMSRIYSYYRRSEQPVRGSPRFVGSMACLHFEDGAIRAMFDIENVRGKANDIRRV